MDEAERIGPARQRRIAPAADDVADRAREGNREAERGGGADGVMHAHVAVRHEGNGNEAAPRAHERRDDADHGARAEHAARAGQRARCHGLRADEHLRGGRVDEDAEKERDPEG